MIVISDTSVLSNLILINRLDILQRVFSEIIIPYEVKAELMKLEDYGIDLSSFTSASWINILKSSNQALIQDLSESLDRGESAAISLALEVNADYLAIDEKAGRGIAKKLGLKIIGLIGILVRAKKLGVIQRVKPILDDLVVKANFYISKHFYDKILEDIGER